jgi:hypothetical protein
MKRHLNTCLLAPFAVSLAALALAGCGTKQTAPPPVVEEAATPAPVPETPPPAPAPVAASQPAVSQSTETVPPAPMPQPVVGQDPAPSEAAPDGDANAAAKPPEKPVDPLVWLKESEAKKAEYATKIADAEAAVAAADAPIELWQRNLLAFKNPYLAPPKLTEADATAIQGTDGVARVNLAQQRLDEAKAAKDAAQQKLDDLKAHPPD